MFFVIEKDNLGREYHNDKLIAIFSSQYHADAFCNCTNGPNNSGFYKVVTSLENMNLDSMYDVTSEIPKIKTFFDYTGLWLFPEKGMEIYEARYGLNREMKEVSND